MSIIVCRERWIAISQLPTAEARWLAAGRSIRSKIAPAAIGWLTAALFLMLREAMKSASPSRPQEMHMKRDRSGLFFCQWYGIQGIPYWCYGDRPDPSCKPCSKIELLPDVPVDDSLQKDLVEQFLFQRSGLQYMYIYCKPDARRISVWESHLWHTLILNMIEQFTNW